MTTPPEVHLVGGSRAEALRIAPIAVAMREQGRATPILIATGPDPAAVDSTFAAFGLTPMITLPTGADPSEALRRFDSFWAARTPAAVVLRDCLPAAMAAHWRRIPVTQIDAGRRCGGVGPTAAEADRRLLAQIATLHMAATPLAAMNLFDERVVAGDVLLSGSTATDAVQALARRRGAPTGRNRRLVLVMIRASNSAEPSPKAGQDPATKASQEPNANAGHEPNAKAGQEPNAKTGQELGRRAGPELGETAVVAALRLLATRHADLEVVPVDPTASSTERARLISDAYVVVTDDEDLAEESLASGTPVLVLGDAATQTESLHAGSARLVGAEPATIAAEVAGLLDSRVRRDGMVACGNPYGDGLAAYRIAQATAALLGHGQFPDPMPARPVAGIFH